MKLIVRVLMLSCLLFNHVRSSAQCTAGFQQATLNWDYLDYLVWSGTYANGTYLTNISQVRTQHFSFGTQRLTITADGSFASADMLGENTNHTGEAGTFASGADVQYIGNGNITVSFQNAVRNVRFSVSDIDRSQVVTLTALNGAAPVVVNMARASGTSLTIVGNGTVTAIATANSTTYANTVTNTVINVSITGPVTSFNLNISATGTCSSSCGGGGNEDGSFYLSDIQACSAGTFPSDYYNVSRPFTGQSGYVLHAFNKDVYALDPATGVTKFLFHDPYIQGSASSSNQWTINSMAYDPYNKILYYVYSLTTFETTNRMLRKYDFNTETISTVVADINSIGIPATTYAGIESGAAAFYNGCLYLGIETSLANRRSGREVMIWKISFDGSGNAINPASQVFALPIDNGSGTLLHDWADFVIKDGVLYDFDGTPANPNIYHFDMMTGNTTSYSIPTSGGGAFLPGQVTVDWAGNLYNLYALAPSESAYIVPYNGAGAEVTANMHYLTSSPAFTPAIPSLGDAAEAFRPKVDFGDAPASYDPNPLSPAVHEYDPLIRLGGGFDREWNTRGQTALANSDNFDDGLPFAPIFNPLFGNYLIQANVFNNTGSPATVGAWLDYDGDGVYEAGEGITVTVPSSASPQSVFLYWPTITSNLSMGSYTYLRVRITNSAALTTANATGFYNNGEVEDYRIPVNTYALSTQVMNFDAQKSGGEKVLLQWNAATEKAGGLYELERSADKQNWSRIHEKPVTSDGNNTSHNYTDAFPLKGVSYYRLKTMSDGAIKYSEIKRIDFISAYSFVISPNPSTGPVKLTISSENKATAFVTVFDMNGRQMHQQKLVVAKGVSTVPLQIDKLLANGIYSVQLQIDNNILSSTLVIQN